MKSGKNSNNVVLQQLSSFMMELSWLIITDVGINLLL